MHFYPDVAAAAAVGTPQDALQKRSIDEGVCDNSSDENKDVHFQNEDGASANKLFLRGVSVDTSCSENVHITQDLGNYLLYVFCPHFPVS